MKYGVVKKTRKPVPLFKLLLKRRSPVGLVEAKCTNCGATLSVDNGKDAMICPYCGSAFVVEKAIQYHKHTYSIRAEKVYINNQETITRRHRKEPDINNIGVYKNEIASKIQSNTINDIEKHIADGLFKRIKKILVNRTRSGYNYIEGCTKYHYYSHYTDVDLFAEFSDIEAYFSDNHVDGVYGTESGAPGVRGFYSLAYEPSPNIERIDASSEKYIFKKMFEDDPSLYYKVELNKIKNYLSENLFGFGCKQVAIRIERKDTYTKSYFKRGFLGREKKIVEEKKREIPLIKMYMKLAW